MGKLLLTSAQNRQDILRNSSEVTALDGTEYIDDRGHIVMRDHAQLGIAAERGETREYGGRSGTCARNWNVLQILQGLNPVLRSLRRDLVTHAILGIQPESRRSLEATAQGNQEIACNFSLGETDFPSFRPIHIDVKLRLVKGLLNAEIRCSRNVLDPLQQLVRELPVGLQIISDNLNIDWGRQAKVQNLSHHIRG